MSKLYKPSNGSEGEWFIANYCAQCKYDIGEHAPNMHDLFCPIISDSMCFNIDEPQYPKEWIYNEHNQPKCTKYSYYKWEKNDNGEWIMPDPDEIPNPSQIKLEL